MENTLFIFHEGSAYPRLESWAKRRPTSTVAKVVSSVADTLRFRRNPRGRDYMEKLSRQVFPDFDPQSVIEIEDNDALPHVDWGTIEVVVLLWPDANGTGWARIERQLFRNKGSSTRVHVLNGRRRSFALNRRELVAFRTRRGMEKTLLLELAFTPVFFVTTPFLALWDLMCGRR